MVQKIILKSHQFHKEPEGIADAFTFTHTKLLMDIINFK